MSVYVDPYSFLEKYLNHILQRPKSAHRIIPPSTEKLSLQDGVVAYPAFSFFIPVPPFISMSNGRPNTRFLRVQALLFTPIHSLPSQAPTPIVGPLL